MSNLVGKLLVGFLCHSNVYGLYRNTVVVGVFWRTSGLHRNAMVVPVLCQIQFYDTSLHLVVAIEFGMCKLAGKLWVGFLSHQKARSLYRNAVVVGGLMRKPIVRLR